LFLTDVYLVRNTTMYSIYILQGSSPKPYCYLLYTNGIYINMFYIDFHQYIKLLLLGT